MKGMKRFLLRLLAVVLAFSLFLALPVTVRALDANKLKDGIEGFTHGGTGNLNASVSGNTVTVTGSVNNATNLMALDIDSGVTVVWKAFYGGAAGTDLFSLTGSGTFEVAAGGHILATGNGKGVFAFDSNLTVNVNGGRVDSAYDAIHILGDNCTVKMSSGVVSSSGGASIYVIGSNCSVTVSGGTVECLSDTFEAIYVHSEAVGTTVNISGGLVFNYDRNNNGAIIMENGGTPVIGGNVVVCSWVRPSGVLAYAEGSETNLNVSPSGASAVWGYGGSATGIHYQNGSNTGFYRIEEVTVAETVPGTAGPFQVTEHPVGATYLLNEDATPIRATFEYGTMPNVSGMIDSMEPITVRWYWSNENSNTGRINGFTETTVEYSRHITHTTTHIPATDEVGVKYYYAVLKYNEQIPGAVTSESSVPKEAVTNPARIEVVAPGEPGGDHGFSVRKTDGEGNLLSGAVLSLTPDSAYSQGAAVILHEVTTVNGLAEFDAAPGHYILSEKQAPSGYNATDEKYNITIEEDGVFIRAGQNLTPYATVTFVNKEIPKLEKDDHFAFMQGYPDGTFRPNANMTRAEAVVMFSRLLSESMNVADDHRNNYYPDVNPTDWFANQVGYMQELGVLASYSRDGRFRPNDAVTRAEFATLATHFDNLDLTDTNNFPDVPNTHWAVKFINSAATKGWITGYPDGGFRPESSITRAEVVTLVGRMVERFADEAYITANPGSLPREYSDLTSSYWGYLMIMEASMGHDYDKSGSGEIWTEVYP